MNGLLIKIKEYDAHGGPEKRIQHAGDKYAATPTQSGRFVIKTIEKHISTGRYFWFSGIPWGAGLKVINEVTYVDVNNNNHWAKLTSIVPQWLKEKKAEDAVTNEIRQRWYSLTNIRTSTGFVTLDTKEFPDKWYFSDFGHISVKYFVDTNHDGIMNNKESIMGDFIHTTPDDEAVSYYNQHRMPSQRPVPLNLYQSHGCIHVKPTDVDIMIGSGYLKKGQSIVVHSYKDITVPATLKAERYTRGGYEAHFFPGLFKIVIYKIT